jgi:hypothetical protein
MLPDSMLVPYPFYRHILLTAVQLWCPCRTYTV